MFMYVQIKAEVNPEVGKEEVERAICPVVDFVDKEDCFVRFDQETGKLEVSSAVETDERYYVSLLREVAESLERISCDRGSIRLWVCEDDGAKERTPIFFGPYKQKELDKYVIGKALEIMKPHLPEEVFSEVRRLVLKS